MIKRKSVNKVDALYSPSNPPRAGIGCTIKVRYDSLPATVLYSTSSGKTIYVGFDEYEIDSDRDPHEKFTEGDGLTITKHGENKDVEFTWNKSMKRYIATYKGNKQLFAGLTEPRRIYHKDIRTLSDKQYEEFEKFDRDLKKIE